jgi:hypothetical protein
MRLKNWMRLKNFLDDADIRSRDPAYDAEFQQELKWRSASLMELLSRGQPKDKERS